MSKDNEQRNGRRNEMKELIKEEETYKGPTPHPGPDHDMILLSGPSQDVGALMCSVAWSMACFRLFGSEQGPGLMSVNVEWQTG